MIAVSSPSWDSLRTSAEASFARMTYLAPDEALASPNTVELLEQIAQQAGEQGAFNLLAEIEEQSTAFESLRKAGFVVYARQRVWKLKENGEIFKPEIPWETASKQNALAVQSLLPQCSAWSGATS